MGKDREGKFHPRKGKPSGSPGEGIGLQTLDTRDIETQLNIADKYTDGEEQPAPNIRVRHPNRNVDKREERQRNKDTQRFNNPLNKTVNETATAERSDTIATELPAMLNKEQFAELANYTNDRCISFYIATRTSANADANRQQDFIGFKNKLQQVTALLRDEQFDQMKIERMLEPGYELLRNETFWSELSAGLAVFVADGYFRFIKMPIAPKEEIVVNASFYLTPLIPVVTMREYFYVLVLSKKQAKLYRSDAFGMQYIPVKGMPNGVEDVVHFEEKGDRDLFRTSTVGAGSGASFHGIGTGRPEPKENLALYFDEVDETIRKEVLHDENVPLLLAGVEYLIPIYKQVAKYKPIWEEAITGSREYEDTQSLHAEARRKMQPYFDARAAKALSHYRNQSATELTSSAPADVVPAAHYGRVSQLFARMDTHIWGAFDEMNNALTIHEAQEKDDECLVDKAIIKTLLHGGEVFLLTKEKMPTDTALAATMRY